MFASATLLTFSASLANIRCFLCGQRLVRHVGILAVQWISGTDPPLAPAVGFRSNISFLLTCVNTYLCHWNSSPKVIITDDQPAMADAVKHILPNTKHLHCLRHVFENVKELCRGSLKPVLLRLLKTAAVALSEDVSMRQYIDFPADLRLVAFS